MVGARLIVHDELVLAKLRQMRKLDQRAILEELGSYLVSSTMQRFRQSESPDGVAWQRHAYNTRLTRIGGRKGFKKSGGLTARARRLLGGMKPLIDRGHLMRSITYSASADQVAIGTNLIYGAIHQFGGQAGRGHKVTIPARPYLGFSRADRLIIDRIITRRVQEVMG